MNFNEIKSYASAYEYAEKRGGVPKVPFAKFWEYYPENEKLLVSVVYQVQQTFNMVQSTEPFKIEYIEKVNDDLFDIIINPGGLIPFKIGQKRVEQKQTAQIIDERLDAHQKEKEEKKQKNTPQKKKEKQEHLVVPGNELYDEFKAREEKILAEIRAELPKVENSKVKAKNKSSEVKNKDEIAKALAEATLALAEATKALAALVNKEV